MVRGPGGQAVILSVFLSLSFCLSVLCRADGMDGMVIIGLRSSERTFGANIYEGC